MNHKIRPPICHQIHHSNWWPTKFSDKNVTNIITQFSESPNEVTNMSHNSSPNLVITKFVTIFITKFVTKHGWVLYDIHLGWHYIVSLKKTGKLLSWVENTWRDVLQRHSQKVQPLHVPGTLSLLVNDEPIFGNICYSDDKFYKLKVLCNIRYDDNDT